MPRDGGCAEGDIVDSNSFKLNRRIDKDQVVSSLGRLTTPRISQRLAVLEAKMTDIPKVVEETIDIDSIVEEKLDGEAGLSWLSKERL